MSSFTMQVYLKAMSEHKGLFIQRSNSFRSQITDFTKKTPRLCDFVSADNSGSLKLEFAGIDLLLDSRERIVFHENESILEFEFFTSRGDIDISVLRVFFDTHGYVILDSPASNEKFVFNDNSFCFEIFEALIKSAYEKKIISI